MAVRACPSRQLEPSVGFHCVILDQARVLDAPAAHLGCLVSNRLKESFAALREPRLAYGGMIIKDEVHGQTLYEMQVTN